MIPSITKMNARYRGPTDSETYVNVFNEMLHDIRRLYYASTESSKKNGHRHFITDNLMGAVSGSKVLSNQTAAPMVPMDTVGHTANSISANLNAIQKELIEWNL